MMACNLGILCDFLFAGELEEEYSVVLITPDYLVDLNSPWTAIFAVCCRQPNCINVSAIVRMYASWQYVKLKYM